MAERPGPRARRRPAAGGFRGMVRRMEDLLERTRELLDRRTAIGMLATTRADGQPDVCLVIAPKLTEDDQVAAGEEASVAGNTFRNLKQNPLATLLVLDPIMDPRARDGVRIHCRFLGAEADGEELGHLSSWLESFAPGRKVVRRLLFKVLEIERYRPPQDEPVVVQ